MPTGARGRPTPHTDVSRDETTVGQGRSGWRLWPGRPGEEVTLTRSPRGQVGIDPHTQEETFLGSRKSQCCVLVLKHSPKNKSILHGNRDAVNSKK